MEQLEAQCVKLHKTPDPPHCETEACCATDQLFGHYNIMALWSLAFYNID